MSDFYSAREASIELATAIREMNRLTREAASYDYSLPWGLEKDITTTAGTIEAAVKYLVLGDVEDAS